MRAWLDHEIEWTDNRLDASFDLPSAPLSDLLTRLGEEARRPGFATAILCEALAAQIAVTLERHFRGMAEPVLAGGLSPRRLRLIDERVRDELAAPTLGELAALCGLSVRQLSRAFRASRGIAIGDYVADLRTQRAARLLREGDSIKAIAYKIGFGTPNSFSSAFRKATGMSPKAYRAVRGGTH